MKLRLLTLASFLLSGLLLNTNSLAQDDGVIVLQDTVTGNQEQPKVLYIVPWQAADDNTMLKQAMVTKLQNDVFAHIERPEHQRQLQFIETLTSPPDDEE